MNEQKKQYSNNTIDREVERISHLLVSPKPLPGLVIHLNVKQCETDVMRATLLEARASTTNYFLSIVSVTTYIEHFPHVFVILSL